MVPVCIVVSDIASEDIESDAYLYALMAYPLYSLVIGLVCWAVAVQVNRRTRAMRWWHHMQLLLLAWAIAYLWLGWLWRHLDLSAFWR
jgi:hypothetical protein